MSFIMINFNDKLIIFLKYVKNFNWKNLTWIYINFVLSMSWNSTLVWVWEPCSKTCRLPVLSIYYFTRHFSMLFTFVVMT